MACRRRAGSGIDTTQGTDHLYSPGWGLPCRERCGRGAGRGGGRHGDEAERLFLISVSKDINYMSSILIYAPPGSVCHYLLIIHTAKSKCTSVAFLQRMPLGGPTLISLHRNLNNKQCLNTYIDSKYYLFLFY